MCQSTTSARLYSAALVHLGTSEIKDSGSNAKIRRIENGRL